jgi:hypothetical protein
MFEEIRWRLRSLNLDDLRILTARALLRALLRFDPRRERLPRRDYRNLEALQLHALWSILDAWTNLEWQRLPLDPSVYDDLLREERYFEFDENRTWDILVAAAFLDRHWYGDSGRRYVDAIELTYRAVQRSGRSEQAFIEGLHADLELIFRTKLPRELISRPLWPGYLTDGIDADRLLSFSRYWLEPYLARIVLPWLEAVVEGTATLELGLSTLRSLGEQYSPYERLGPPAAARRAELGRAAPSVELPPAGSAPAASAPPPAKPMQIPSAASRPSALRRVRNIAATVAEGAVVAAARAVMAAAAGAVLGVKELLVTVSNTLSQRSTPTTEAADSDEAPPGARYTDIRIFSGIPDRLGAQAVDEALVFDQDYTLEVAIRHAPTGLPTVGERPNVGPLLSTTEPSELLAVLTSNEIAPGDAEDLDIPHPVQVLVVPSTGDSEESALFQIRPQRGSGATRRCNLMLRLYYQLDLVDQLKISLLIGAKRTAKDQADGSLPRLFIDTVEVRTLPAFTLNLSLRSLNIVVSRPSVATRIRLDFVMPEDDLHLVGTVDISNNDLEDLFSKIRDRLLAMALSAPIDKIAISEPIYRDHLLKLAQLGENAKQLLFDFSKTGSEASLRRIEQVLRTKLSPKSIVQIVVDDSASDFRFPWSIMFCGADPRRVDKVSDFWGYRFIIEEKPARPLLAGPSSSEQRELCFAVWDQLETLKSQRVVLDGGTKALPPIVVNTVDSRDQLLKALRSDIFDVLYVFAHGHSCSPAHPAISALLEKFEHAEQNPLTKQLIALFKSSEIAGLSESDDSWIKLTKSLVTCADLRRDEYALNRHPIVFLNMCQSAVLWPGATSSFVRLFLDRRASAVLGTECTIPENVADEFGRLVIEKLFQHETVGASVLHAREELARSNNLLGLAYSLYGSASANIRNGLELPSV